MNIVQAMRQLDTAIAAHCRPANLEEIQSEVLLARGRISDRTLDSLQAQINQVARYS